MLMTSSFVCATLNLERKKSTGTEPYNFIVDIGNAGSQKKLVIFKNKS